MQSILTTLILRIYTGRDIGRATLARHPRFTTKLRKSTTTMVTATDIANTREENTTIDTVNGIRNSEISLFFMCNRWCTTTKCNISWVNWYSQHVRVHTGYYLFIFVLQTLVKLQEYFFLSFLWNKHTVNCVNQRAIIFQFFLYFIVILHESNSVFSQALKYITWILLILRLLFYRFFYLIYVPSKITWMNLWWVLLKINITVSNKRVCVKKCNTRKNYLNNFYNYFLIIRGISFRKNIQIYLI